MFGATGRLGSLCGEVLRDAARTGTYYVFRRDGSFVSHPPDGAAQQALRPAELRDALRDQPVLFCDCSIDHSGTEAMQRHEVFKRDLCAWLDERGALRAAIGFSSGIARLAADRIRPHAEHMRAYRAVKLTQERHYQALRCPVFLPALFTLIGPRTYARQAAAWAVVLKWRTEGIEGAVLHDPFTRRFWVDESTVRLALADFLAGSGPERIMQPLVDGIFNLDEVARIELADGAAPLGYTVGTSSAWHDGDYLCDHTFASTTTLPTALDRCLVAH